MRRRPSLLTSLKGQRWFMFQNMGPAPSPRFGSTFAAVGDKIIAMGGESTSGKSDENPYAVHVLDCSKYMLCCYGFL